MTTKPHIRLKSKPTITVWLNVYLKPWGDWYHAGGIFQSKDNADNIAKSYRFAVVPVEVPVIPNKPKKKKNFWWRKYK